MLLAALALAGLARSQRRSPALPTPAPAPAPAPVPVPVQVPDYYQVLESCR